MKKIYYLASLALAAALATSSCSEQDFPSVNPADIPQAADYADLINVAIDNETNQVTFTLDAPGVMPVWIIDGAKYSTVNGLSRIYAAAGDYEIEVKVLNKNGMSDGSVFKQFHIENSIIDYGKYLTLLAGDGTREWRIDNQESGHLGCGEPGTDGTNWWSAGPDEKASVGLYDNRLKFDKDYNYTFVPGDCGTIYVNKDVTRFDGYSGSEDYNVPATEQTTKYQFEVVGNDLFLILEKGAFFPYIANNDIYDKPRYKVQNITANKLELVSDNGGIAWHYTLTSKADTSVKPFTGFKYDSDYNLWKTATVNGPFFWYAPGWSQIADPAVTTDGRSWSFNLSEATTDQWQAQMHLDTNLASNSATEYDFSVVITTSKDHPKITVKLTDATDDGNFFMADVISTKAYEDYVYYFSGKPGIDAAALNLFFDFGGNAADTEVIIKDVVFKDHANDDGTILPTETPDVPEGDVVWYEDAPANLWKTAEFDMWFYYATGNDWSQLPDPTFTADNYVYTVELPTLTVNQWQAQVHFKSNLATTSATNYDFKCVLNSTTDIRGVTVKMCQDDDDGNVIFEEHIDLIAYEDVVFKAINKEGKDAPRIKVVFDFGGCSDNTVVKISDVVFQEHAKPIEWDVNAANNIWGFDNITWYYAITNSWQQQPDPATTVNGNVITATLPLATVQRWQAQMVFHSSKSTSDSKKYNFHCVLNCSASFTVMVKLTQEDNDEVFYFADEVAVEAYEDYVFDRLNMTGLDIPNLKLVLDFGGCPDNTEVSISDIILLEN